MKTEPCCAMVLQTDSIRLLRQPGLEVPPDAGGDITLFVFCDGFVPFKQIMNVSGLKMNKKASDSLPEGVVLRVSSEIIITPAWTYISVCQIHGFRRKTRIRLAGFVGKPGSESELPPAEERSSINSTLSYILGREPSDPGLYRR